ncbi:MAG: alpha-amylase family glycosyl hydrolase [Acidimicrobiia bacterium]
MSDWISEAASEAWQRLAPTQQTRFSAAEWAEFSARAETTWEQLFRLLHRLYGWRYDFAWSLSEILDVAANGYLERRKRHRRVDREPRGEWLKDQSTLWAMTYLDLYSGTAQKLPDRLDHLQSLGITHLHLLPPYAVPEGANDGGYAVTDYRRLRPDLGTTKQLRRSIDQLRTEGVGVVLDLVCNHTAEDHPWARAALDGDSQFADFYFFFPNRTVPDQLSPHLRPIFPARGGDAFTWLPDKKLWVWTTFHSYQWDLNYRNPRVLAAVAGEMLFLANLGVAAIRMDATPFLWKEPGTSCENRPEAHLVLQILRLVADLACPSVVFLSEAIVHPDDVASFVNPAECELGYNPLLMTSLWDALATEDVRFLVTALRDRFALPPGCHWLTYLRSHDDIGWGFADEDAVQMGVDPRLHRRYLNRFYSGAFPGSFARGELFQHHQQTGDARISGSLASLAGLESALEDADPAATDLAVDRILAAFAVTIFAGGIPLLMLGDEVGSLSDHSYRADPLLAADNRWSHRHRFSEEAFALAALGIGPEGRVLAGLQSMLELRRSLPPLGQPRTFATGHRATIGFENGPIMVLVNLGQSLAILENPPATHDLLRNEDWQNNVLAPYEFRILTNPGFVALYNNYSSPENG